MEKFPFKKFNQIRKVASAAIHMAAMDPSHAAINQHEHVTHIKKPGIESSVATPEEAQTTQEQSKEEQLAENLKKVTEDYFKNEKEAS